jgi:hypothetical protein
MKAMTSRPSDSSLETTREAGGRASRLGHAAVAIGAVVAVALLVSFAIFAVAYLAGGWSAVDDTWVGMTMAVALLGGLLASLVAFVCALIVVIRHERWAPLWLPLLLFPTMLSFLALGELLWWE